MGALLPIGRLSPLRSAAQVRLAPDAAKPPRLILRPPTRDRPRERLDDFIRATQHD